MRIRVWLFYHYPDGCIPKNTRRKRNKVARDFSNNWSLSLFSTALRQSKCGSFYHELTYLVHIVGKTVRGLILCRINCFGMMRQAPRTRRPAQQPVDPLPRLRTRSGPVIELGRWGCRRPSMPPRVISLLNGRPLPRWWSRGKLCAGGDPAPLPPRSEARRSSADPPGRVGGRRISRKSGLNNQAKARTSSRSITQSSTHGLLRK